jgi:hypothetical protein
MAPRRRPGIDATRTATDIAVPVVYAVVIDDIPRAGLTPREFAAMTRQTYEHVCDLIREGKVRVRADAGRSYVIPTSELAEWQRGADYLDPTA